MGAFKVNRRGTGSAQYHPRMMLALLIYCYANGIFSSRRIERATRRDIGVRFVVDEDILNPGQYHYLIWLAEDWRGWKRTTERSKLRETIQRWVETHHLL